LFGLLVGMGVERSIIYYLGKSESEKKVIWGNACFYFIVALLTGALFLLPCAYLLRGLLGEIRFHLIALAFLIVPFERFFSFQLGMLNGLGQIRTGNLFASQSSLFLAGFAALFILWFWPASESVLIAHVCAFALTVVLTAFFWGRKAGITFAFAYDSNIFRNLVLYGSRGQIGNLTRLLASRCDLLILNYYMGRAAAGVYSVALNFTELLMFLPLIFSYVFFPHVSRRSAEESWRLIAQVSRLALFLTLVFALLVAVLGPFLIPFIFTSDFEGAVKPLWILLPGTMLIAVFSIIVSGIGALGFPFYSSLCTAVGAILAVGLNLVLIPRYQEFGAAWSGTLSSFLSFVFLMAMLKTRFKKRPAEFLVVSRKDLSDGISLVRGLVRK